LLLAHCVGRVVPLRSSTAEPDFRKGLLSVMATTCGTPDPLPVAGASISLSQVIPALSDAVATSCAAWV
jgi:hypothetical protein